jgi:NAD+ synthase (glutamine-hydrolysing)
MRLVRLGIAPVNPTVGAVRDNTDRCIAACHALAKDGVTLGALPEHVIGGYPPEDLVQWRGFVEAEARELVRLCRATAELPTVFALGLSVDVGGQVYNCAALVHRGQVLGLCPKEKLPLYNVFYDARTFARGAPGRHAEVELPDGGGRVPFGDLVFRFDFGTVALEVCEDIWSPDGPMRRRCFAGAEVVVNLSASPYRVGVVETRREMVCTRAADNNATVVYVNAVGANDGLVFDGGGFVSQNGRLLLEGPRFSEGVAAANVDLDRTRRLRAEITTWRTDYEDFVEKGGGAGVRVIVAPGATIPGPGDPPLSYPTPRHRSFFLPGPAQEPTARERFCEDLLDVMALGIGDYYEKTRAFRRIGVALSGGRDSLLCLLLAHRYVTRRAEAQGLDAAGRARLIEETLRAFYMPTRYSSAGTRRAAEVAARELGVPFVVLSIDEAFEREAQAARAMLQPGEELTPITIQNIQSRLRAQRMWNWSNATSGLFLQTGNMSEKAVGYTTVGGDLMGCIAPIANLPKTVVNYLLDYLLEQRGFAGIRVTLEIPASAELAENQEDERDLMPFPVLDSCFALYAGEKLQPAEIEQVLRGMFPEYAGAQIAAWVAKFVRLFVQSIYKWVQSPLSIHVGNLDLERERALQLPVVQRPQWGQ